MIVGGARLAPLASVRRMSSKIRADLASFPGGRSRSCGIVGMPNVGKSTLFNALTNTQAAQAANYPFCTIEPNVGRVAIPDERLETLAQLAGSAKVTGSQLEFVDIAGLVRGASEGAGLGNKFLGNIRQVSMILMLLRCFEDTDKDTITHVDGSVDPVRDLETIETELLLADIQTLTKRELVAGKKKGAVPWSLTTEKDLIARVLAALDDGTPARDLMLTEEEAPIFRQLQLLTGKPMLVACNVSESEVSGNVHTRKVEQHLEAQQARKAAADLNKKDSAFETQVSHVRAIAVSCRLEVSTCACKLLLVL
jgi:GTP-binding protein YchF